MNKKKSKQPKDLIPKEKREMLLKSHALIHETIRFWESRMDFVVQEIEEAENMPDWMPDKEMTYDVLTREMEFIVSKLGGEEREIERLEEDTNKLLAEMLFVSFKKIDEKKSSCFRINWPRWILHDRIFIEKKIPSSWSYQKISYR